MPGRAQRWRAFTILELLAAIAIIGILLALLLPAVQAARTAARRTACQNRMRQTGQAIHLYIEANDVFPPSKCTYTYTKNSTNKATVGHGLVPFLLPYIEQTASFSQYHFEKNWQNAANQKAREVRIATLLCSEAASVRLCRAGSSDSDSHRRIVEYFCSDYTSCDVINARTQLRNLGIDRRDWRGILAPAVLGTTTNPILRSTDPTADDVLSALKTKPITPRAIRDGLSNTMLLFECTSRPKKYDLGKVAGNPDSSPKEPIGGARWADDASQMWLDSLCYGTQMFNCTNHQEIFSLHPGGCNFVYGDGAVRFHTEKMAPDAFVSCFTAYAGDTAPLP